MKRNSSGAAVTDRNGMASLGNEADECLPSATSERASPALLYLKRRTQPHNLGVSATNWNLDLTPSSIF